MNIRLLLVSFLATLVAAGAHAQQSGDADPLFQDLAVLELTITAPMKALLKERPDDEYLPGSLSYFEADGSDVNIDIGIRTRGNFRRQKRVCPFPPLRVNFDKSQTKGTVFRKQDKVKLVAHCRDNSERYEQNVFREYLAYRILNTLTNSSYRARLVRVTYVDSDEKQDDRVQYGFFIEHKNRVSKRLGLAEIVSDKLAISQLDGAYSDLTSLFQYMIGNTDFSPIAAPEGESCCHNSTPFGNEGEPIYSIPYDFDMSGLVDAPYAEVNPQFKIRRVTQRVYRGRCAHIGNLDESLQAFQDSRSAIYALIDSRSELTSKTRKSILKFIDGFYEDIDDPEEVEKRIVSKCI